MILKVDYDEFEPETYRGVILTKDGEEVHRVNGGDFTEDYVGMIQWIKENAEQTHISKGSSVDHFIMDKKSITV